MIRFQIQWGSENRTFPVFEWFKVDRFTNGPVFEWHLKTGPKCMVFKRFRTKQRRPKCPIFECLHFKKSPVFKNGFRMFGFWIPTVVQFSKGWAIALAITRVTPSVIKSDHSKSGYFCQDFIWCLTKQRSFVGISNGWASRFQISFETNLFLTIQKPNQSVFQIPAVIHQILQYKKLF